MSREGNENAVREITYCVMNTGFVFPADAPHL